MIFNIFLSQYPPDVLRYALSISLRCRTYVSVHVFTDPYSYYSVFLFVCGSHGFILYILCRTEYIAEYGWRANCRRHAGLCRPRPRPAVRSVLIASRNSENRNAMHCADFNYSENPCLWNSSMSQNLEKPMFSAARFDICFNQSAYCTNDLQKRFEINRIPAFLAVFPRVFARSAEALLAWSR